MAQLSKTFYPYDPLPAADLNTLVSFMNGIAAGTNIEDGAVTADKIDFTTYDGTQPGYESGSNANGGYTKFPDGTMICRTGRVATTYGSTQNTIHNWTYPEEFIEDPSITITIDETGATGVGAANIRYGQVISSQLSNTQAQLRVRCDASSVSNPATIYVYAIAIGRWK